MAAAAQTRPPASKTSTSTTVGSVATLPTEAGEEWSVTLTTWMVDPAVDTA